MNKFYNPSMYKEPEKKEEEFFAQVGEESFGEYKKSEASGGIIQMMDQMIKDTEMDMAEAKRDEEEAQKDYEQAMNDAAAKRTDDSKLIVTKDYEQAMNDAAAKRTD